MVKNIVKLVVVAAWMSSLCVGVANAQKSLSHFTEDVLLHVLVHEMGHALIREFDLPVLGNEEVMVDEFATIYIYQTMPTRAGDIVAARVKAWKSKGDLQPIYSEPTVFSEHANNARRAGRATCLLVGLDPIAHRKFALSQGMTDKEISSCRGSAPEIARGWRRILAPLAMPRNTQVTEVGVFVNKGPWKDAINRSEIKLHMRGVLSSFDWHSRVTLLFSHCDRGASWSRSRRRILLCDGYIEFLERLNATK